MNSEKVKENTIKPRFESQNHDRPFVNIFKKLELSDYHCKQVAISNMLRISEDIKYNSEKFLLN